jgi:hypothetical protein
LLIPNQLPTHRSAAHAINLFACAQQSHDAFDAVAAADIAGPTRRPLNDEISGILFDPPRRRRSQTAARVKGFLRTVGYEPMHCARVMYEKCFELISELGPSDSTLRDFRRKRMAAFF